MMGALLSQATRPQVTDAPAAAAGCPEAAP